MAYVVLSEQVQILIRIIVLLDVIPEETANCIMFFSIYLRRIAFQCFIFTEFPQSYACFKRNDRLSGNLVGISINLCKSIQKELFINDAP